MFDPESLLAMFDQLDSEQQAKVREWIDLRNELAQDKAKVVKRLLQQRLNLQSGVPSDVEDYVDLLDSKKQRLMELTIELARDIVDLDKVKSLLPMMGFGALQGVNLPLLVAMSGLDLSDVVKFFNLARTSLFGAGKTDTTTDKTEE